MQLINLLYVTSSEPYLHYRASIISEELSEPNDGIEGSLASQKSESEVSSSGSSLGEEFYDQLEMFRDKFFALASNCVRESEVQ